MFSRRSWVSAAGAGLMLLPSLVPMRAGATDGGAASVAAEADDIVVVTHRLFPSKAIDAARLEAIFSAIERSGANGKPIIAFNYAPEDKLRVEFDRVVLHMTPEQVSRYWIDQRIRGGQRAPRQVSDPVLVLRLVGKLPGAIGYIPNRLVDDTVSVVARIRAGKVISP